MVAAVAAVALSLTSPSFHSGARIPRRYTCDGRDVSPPLRWRGVPAGAKTLAVELDDPDAPGGVFRHWSVWNLPSRERALPEHARRTFEGRNSFGRVGYSGPCPPAGPAHRYVFTLLAVDRQLALPRGAPPARLHAALEGHVVARTTLTALYGR